jgi:hypothetical protein
MFPYFCYFKTIFAALYSFNQSWFLVDYSSQLPLWLFGSSQAPDIKASASHGFCYTQLQLPLFIAAASQSSFSSQQLLLKPVAPDRHCSSQLQYCFSKLRHSQLPVLTATAPHSCFFSKLPSAPESCCFFTATAPHRCCVLMLLFLTAAVY